MKIKLKKYIITFLLGCFITSILFIPSFNVDGICTKFFGYKETSLNFLNAGRLLTYFSYLFFDKIKLSLEGLSILSITISNLFLSITIIDFYKLIKTNDKKANVILYILSFFLVYNPITLELFLFDEAFIMCLGVMFGIKAVSVLNTNNKHKYLISLLLVTLCVMCYQGIVCIFLPIGFLNIILSLKSKEFKNNIIEIIHKFVNLCIIYGLSLIINFIIVKFIDDFISSSQKVGSLNIIKNITYIINFIISTIRGMNGYVNVKIYYIFMFSVILCLIFILLKRKKRSDVKYTIYIIFNVILCILTPFVINLAMNTEENYTAARMYISIGFIIPILSIYLVKIFDILNIKYLKIIFSSLIILYSIYVSYNYFYITKGGLDSYNMDIEYIQQIEKRIKKYEYETDNVVENVYWVRDIKSNFCNDVGFCNSYSYRFFSFDWSAKSSIGVLKTKKTLKYIPMNDKQKNKYFNDIINIDFEKYNDKQLVFDKNNLYLLIY